jgi:hypothetical protein
MMGANSLILLVLSQSYSRNCRGHRGCHARIGAKLSPGASYLVTDLNQPMLDYAAPRQSSNSRINGSKRMLGRYHLKMRPSISFVVSSARCSLPTAHLPIGKQSES